MGLWTLSSKKQIQILIYQALKLQNGEFKQQLSERTTSSFNYLFFIDVVVCNTAYSKRM